MMATACPELTPGAGPPFTSADGYALYRTTRSGPFVARTVNTELSGTISPRAFRHFKLTDAIGARAERRIGLRDDAECPTKTCEVVDVRGAQVDAKRAEYVGECE